MARETATDAQQRKFTGWMPVSRHEEDTDEESDD